MIIKLSLDSKRFNEEPSEKEASIIEKRIGNHIKEISIEDFADSIVQPSGRTFSPAVFRNGERSNENWESQQVFVVDIDDGVSVEEIIDTSNRFNILPAFIYTTFPSTSKQPKYRVVFVVNEKIEDIRVRNLISKSLMKVFFQSKTASRDSARIIFGGREIAFRGFSNVITVPDVFHAACSVIKNGSNPSRDMQKFCMEVGINMQNGYPKLFTFNDEKDMPQYDSDNVFVSMTKKRTSPINNKCKCTLISHMGYIIYFCNNNTKDYYFGKENDFSPLFNIQKQSVKKTLVRNYPFEDLYDNCRLYREAIEGRYWLYYNEMYGLMTNLLQIKGGVSKLDDILESRREYREKEYSWQGMKKQILKGNYAPSRCDNYCPFIEDCIHGLNLIEQGKLFKGKVQVIGKSKVRGIEEVRRELKDVVSRILASSEMGIHIVKAPTGIGKTEEYINACRDKNLTIAAPTHMLKEEISTRLSEIGIRHYAVPQLPNIEPEQRQKLDRLYNTGSFAGANVYLRELAKENEEVARYITDLKRIRNVRNQSILTTHQRVIFDKDFNDTLVIDEDIILNGMFQFSTISVLDLATLNQILLEIPKLEAVRKIVENIFLQASQAPENIVQKTPNYFMLCAKEIEEIIVMDNRITSNILGFLNSSHYLKVTNPDGGTQIQFISKRELPDKKIIIFSATISEKIAKMVFGNNVTFYDLGEVEHVGERWQIPSLGFSRQSIKKNFEEMLNIAEGLINKYNTNSKIITYKGYLENLSESTMSFWNNAGRDDLKGENITVIGTPHVNPNCYLLFASALGYDVQLNESKFMYQPVSKGPYNFYFNTYGSNDFLREIQFYMIESELVQTVGRARTITEPCRVLILSNYPVPGAEFIPLSLKEIKEYMAT